MQHMPLDALCDLIERRFHRPLDEQLPRIGALMDEVGAAQPQLAELVPWVMGLVGELGQHMLKEEQVLFPIIRQTGHAPPPPVSVMRAEHTEAHEALAAIAKLTGGFTAPADAGETQRALYAELQTLDRELREHIRIENDILFPRASML
jgi:regulator of cell morphogenesis and NO signaling